ncbi:solute carrier family 23 member 3 [Polyodon spathula]|uniref:solute carrier family 23 member 3 n=1 Tax=Polyodon spathula TaxID=7913 RepID=UPI001B7E38D7|nr:solute carrier family 23 member 3 [Polyodon spathula]
MCGSNPDSKVSEETAQEKSQRRGFRVHQNPPWFLNILLAVQHVVIQSSMLVLVHSLLNQTLQEEGGEWSQYNYQCMATSLFSSGISTLLQTMLGTRLPLLQAPSMEFLIPAVILTSQKIHRDNRNGTEVNYTLLQTDSVSWSEPVRELQGAVVIAGILQILLGLSGVCGVLSLHCGPLVIAPTLCIIGFSIFKEAALFCSANWGVAALVVLLIILLSQHFHSYLHHTLLSITEILLPVVCVWIVCTSLEAAHIFPRQHVEELAFSRDRNISDFVPWLWIPFPGERGLPLMTVPSLAAGVAAALSAGMCSQECYMATARLLEAPPPPPQAYNRGLCMEGLGSTIAGMLGSVTGVTTSVANACAHGLNQCGSRQSIQLSAVLCLLLGASPKLTQLLATIPLAVHGGILSVTYTVAIATGITYFQNTDMDSGRNIFNIGFTVFMGLLVPQWVSKNPGSIVTGVQSIDVLLLSLLTIPVFLGGVLAFLLDNTVSGTAQERGLPADVSGSRASAAAGYSEQQALVYSLPSAVRMLLAHRRLANFPFCTISPPEEVPSLEEVTSAEERADLLLSCRSEGEATPNWHKEKVPNSE